MTIIDRGILEVAADVSGVEAGMAKAQRSIRGLGKAAKDESARTSASIDKYVRGLQTQAATFGKTARESELYRLKLRGANAAQLAAADSALRLQEQQRLLQNQMGSLRTAATRLGVVLGTGLIAAAVGFDRLVKDAANFQDVAEKMGDSAENVASLAVAAAEGGSNVDTLAQASVRLNKSLTGVDDESAAAGAAVKALGLDLATLKKQSPVDQLETVAKAMANFEDGTEKGAIAVALFGRAGAELLPTFKVLAQEGARQNILTAEQIRLADEYADAQAHNTEQIKLYAEAIATDALPLLSELTGTIAELAKDQEFAATASDLLQGAIKSAIVVFQTVAIVASDVGFVFKGVGREIGAIAAQLAALARLDFAGFSAISDAVREDAEKARKELDRFQARVMAIGRPGVAGQDPSFQRLEDRRLRPPSRPRLQFDGAVKKDKGGAAKKEARDLLNADLDEIRRQAAELEDIFAASEKIMEARRSADLVNDREYFDAKLGFINLHQQAEEAALQKEIDRLRSEAVNDENRLEIAKKIADAEAKMTKLRVQGAAQREVLGIQEAESIRKTTQAYVDATVAAREYLDTIAKRNQRELDGVGKGEKFRARQGDLNAIEDDFTKERQRLEREKRRGEINQQVFDQYLEVARSTYAEEVRLYNERTIAMEAKQGDWVNGFTESLSNYIDNARDVAGQSKELFDNAFQGLEDAIVKFAQTGKLSFKDLINSIAADLTRMATKQVLADALEGIKGGALGDTIGGLFKGISPKKAGGDGGLSAQTAQTSASLVKLQTAGIDPTVTSLIGLQQAADAAAAAVVQLGANRSFEVPETPVLTTGDFARMDRGQPTGEQTISDLFKDADKSGQVLAKTNAAAANSILQFASAAARGGDAMSMLPSIIQSIIAAASVSNSSGGGGNLLSSIFSMFGGGGGADLAGAGGGAGNYNFGGGFSKGGYTGDGDVTETAGIVHGKEFVFSAPAVKTIGLDTLESMHRDARQGKLKDEELETISAVAGGRAIGGPVSAGGLYRVVEKGQPEVLTIGNKQFLMMGAQGGEVETTTPADKARAERAKAPSLIMLDRRAAVQPVGMIDSRISERLIDRQSNTATSDSRDRVESNAITVNRIANTSFERVERSIGSDRSVETSRFMKLVEGGEISLATNDSSSVVQMTGGDTISSTTIGAAAAAADGRALGGPVSPNRIYRVNEEGPEILKIAGKQYLMTGDQAGQVTPGSGSKAGDTYNTIHVNAALGMTREQAMNQGRDFQRGMQAQAAARARNT